MPSFSPPLGCAGRCPRLQGVPCSVGVWDPVGRCALPCSGRGPSQCVAAAPGGEINQRTPSVSSPSSNAVEANYAWQKWCNILSMCSSSSNSSLSLAALNATRTPATSTTRIAKWRRAAGGGGGQQRRPAGGGGGRRRRARFRGSEAARLPCELPTRPPPAWFGRFLNSYQVIELSVTDSQVMLVRFQ